MSNSVRPHRRQPTRLHHPWDSPGNNAGVGCHFLLQCMKVKSENEVAQLCPTLRDPMDCSLLGSSVHGIFQARVLEWVAIAFSEFFFMLHIYNSIYKYYIIYIYKLYIYIYLWRFIREEILYLKNKWKGLHIQIIYFVERQQFLTYW